MPLLWLRVALVFYGFGLLYALLTLTGRGRALVRLTVPAVAAGVVFHFVSLAEAAMATGQWTPVSLYHSESLLAFLVMVFFFVVYWRYQTTAPGIFVFPLAFLLTFSSAIGQQPLEFASPLMRSGWIVTHIGLIFTGYAALFLSFAASLLYLLQERSLKAKRSQGVLARLPALEVIDEIGYRSLLLGFPFMTLGLLAGSVVAAQQFGPSYLLDPKVLLSLVMWALYMILLYTRWSAGWRGRRAAFLSTAAFVVAVGAWAANYFSEVHRFTP
jgi:ABC-type uncharacterized transport system permease subunit